MKKFSKLLQCAVLFSVLLATLQLSQAQVSLPNGTVSESAVDLRVKVLGGMVTVDRQFNEGKWEINLRWKGAILGGEPDVQGSCTAYPQIKVQGHNYDGDGEAWSRQNRYSIRATDYFPGNDCNPNRIKTLRWQDRNTGNWMEYQRSSPSELQFPLIKYGDRNNVSVSLTYDTQGNLQEVRDHLGSLVLKYLYTNGLLTEIQDNPALIPGNAAPLRSVKYSYTSTTYKGQTLQTINQVTDVLGNLTKYTIANGNLTQITDAEGRSRSYQYTADHVTQYTDPDGKKTTYTYDYDKQKKQFYVRTTSPATADGSRILETWYDSEGVLIRRDINSKTDYQRTIEDTANRSTTSVDSAGRKTETVKDEFDNIIKTVYPDGAITSAKYSSIHGGLLEQTDELGIKTSYDYDSKGNLIKQTEAVGQPEQRITEYTRDAYGQITQVTRKGGNTVLPNGQTVTTIDTITGYQYDNLGNITQITDAQNNSSTYQYDIQGNIIQQTDAKGNVWKAQYNAKGQLTQATDPLNHTSQIQYDKVGNRISITNALGNVTTYQYEKQNRPISIEDPLGNSRTQQIDELGQVTAEIDALGNPTRKNRYDLKGRLIEVTDAAGNSTGFVYDDAQEPYAPVQINFPSYIRSFTYDSRSRLIKTQDSATSTTNTPNGSSQITTYTSTSAYDKKGQQTQVTDRLGNVTQIAYDALGHVRQTTDANNGISHFNYDARDNLIAVTDANGNTTQYQYDANNRRIKEIRPLGQITSYAYDSLGNLTQQTDAKGNKIVLTYDAANRRVKEEHTAAGSNSPNRTITYTYNAVGALTGYSDSNSGHSEHQSHSASYTLDALQRKTQESITLGSQTITLGTSYNAIGRKASQTWPDGSTISYSWDAAQQLKDIQIPSAGNVSTTARNWNQPQNMLYPGGSTKTNSYDGFARLTNIRIKSPNQVDLMQRGYQYDAESNITAINSEQGNSQYQYDPVYRLTTVNTSTTGLPNEQYSYDKLGNRTSDSRKPNPSQSNKSWQYNGNNQLLESATEDSGILISNSKTITHSYDVNGSLTQKATPNGSQSQYPTDNQKYLYDAQNRLTEVQDPNGNRIASYQYDPFGRRIRKTINRSWDGSAWAIIPQPQITTYFYSDEGLIAEYQAQGNTAPQLKAQYGWEPNGTWGTNPVWISTLKQGATQPETFYYQNDHLGTPQKIIDSQGTIVWSQRATAFGETMVDATSTITNNLRFPGQYADQETNTNYNYFRDYSAQTGRYVQSDPIGLKGGMNIYIYVWGGPLGFIDPLGLYSSVYKKGNEYSGIPSPGALCPIRSGEFIVSWKPCPEPGSGAENGCTPPSPPTPPNDPKGYDGWGGNWGPKPGTGEGSNPGENSGGKEEPGLKSVEMCVVDALIPIDDFTAWAAKKGVEKIGKEGLILFTKTLIKGGLPIWKVFSFQQCLNDL